MLLNFRHQGARFLVIGRSRKRQAALSKRVAVAAHTMERERGIVCWCRIARRQRDRALKCCERTIVIFARDVSCSHEQPYPHLIGVLRDHFVQDLHRAGGVTVSKSYPRAPQVRPFFFLLDSWSALLFSRLS